MADKATASDNVVPATGNPFLDTLIYGHKWNDDHPVTFYFDDGTEPEDVWLEAAKDAMREALAIYETYIDLEFEEVDDPDDANFTLVMNTRTEIGGTARFGDPEESTANALGQFPNDWSRWTEWHLQVGGYAFATVVHELGHGLGLGHPHETSGLNNQTFPGVENSGDTGDGGHNDAIYTVMSYVDWGQPWAPEPEGSDYGWGYTASPMAFDVAALQHIYGPNPTTNSGNTTYTLPTVNGDGTYWRAIWDTGGTDMIRHTGSAGAVIDLRAAPLIGANAGGYLSGIESVAGGFTIANGVVIEYAQGGTGNDTLIGNEADNEMAGGNGSDAISGFGGDDLLDGGNGNDTLNGGTGADTLVGGAGNDNLVIDSALDAIHEGADGGIDTVVSTLTHTLGANFENLQLAESNVADIDGYGNSGANDIVGNSDANVLEGRGGDDFINGGGGRDTINGGTGEDTAFGGDGNDSIDGGADDGVIVLAQTASVQPPWATIKTLPDPDGVIDDFRNDQRALPVSTGFDDELHGGNNNDTVNGRGGDDLLYGDAGNDSMIGGNGADWLDGGSGRDTMSGGNGNDIYVVDSSFDIVQESASSGVDGVYSAIDYVLGTHVENLALTGSYLNHISGTGNALANWITGNAGSNVIEGLGADDLLLGMAGNDFIDGGTGRDTIFGGEGNDVLDGGADALVGDGPVFVPLGFGVADGLSGGNGNDTLYGRGGDDLLLGDAGNDELYGEDGADSAAGGEGNDTLGGGSGGDSLVGDEGDDSLAGGSGNDRMNGAVGNDSLDGGTGGDTMTGGAGNDLFAVDSADDLVLEGLNLGIDGVYSTITYTLPANVENLQLLASPTPNIDGTGNALANLMIGNAQANELSGLDGDDFLIGLGGDDDLHGGDGNDSLQGSDGDDTIRGQGGDDVIAGGTGDDRLRGNAGADRFEFAGAFGDDTLPDFDPEEGDRLRISGFGFGLDSFAELQAYVSVSGGNTIIDLFDLGGGTIRLQGFTGLEAADVELIA